MIEKSFGEIAYEAFNAHHPAAGMPWAKLPVEFRHAWNHAAQAVELETLRRQPHITNISGGVQFTEEEVQNLKAFANRRKYKLDELLVNIKSEELTVSTDPPEDSNPEIFMSDNTDPQPEGG